MKITVLSALAASALVASPAIAAEGAGLRFEGRVGVERLTLDAKYGDGTTTLSESGHDSGFELGIEGGYDVALGNAGLVGVYAGIEGATTKDCVYSDTEKFCLLPGRNLTAGVRAGARLSPKIALYAKAGYSNGQLRATYEDEAEPDVIYKWKGNRGGMHFGGGVESALSATTYMRVEYVRTNYSAFKGTEGAFSASLDSRRDQILIGGGVRF